MPLFIGEISTRIKENVRGVDGIQIQNKQLRNLVGNETNCYETSSIKKCGNLTGKANHGNLVKKYGTTHQ